MSGETRSRTTLRLASILVFLAVPIAAAAFAVTLGLAWQEDEQLIERQEMLLRQLDMRLARVGADGAVVVDTRPIYLPARNRPLAGAALQTLIATRIAEAGGKLIEAQPIDEDTEAPADAIDLKVTFDVVNAGFLGLLHGLETGLPLVTVEALDVRRLPTQDETAAVDDPVLRIDLTIRAYFKAEA